MLTRYIASSLDVTSTTTYMEATVVISPGTSMTVEPGVTLQAQTNTGMIAYGAVTMSGTGAAPISLTGVRPAPGEYLGRHQLSAPAAAARSSYVAYLATNGKGFVAEQSIYNKAATTVYGTAGLAQ